MYLLIPSKTAILIIIVQRFTSHYVSINSGNRLKYCRKVLEFTSHYVSINSFYSITSAELSSTFTSHYVSINSWLRESQSHYHLYLHPTMYLLIRHEKTPGRLSLSYLHPTMYLLIHKLHQVYMQNHFIYIPLCIY